MAAAAAQKAFLAQRGKGDAEAAKAKGEESRAALALARTLVQRGDPAFAFPVRIAFALDGLP